MEKIICVSTIVLSYFGLLAETTVDSVTSLGPWGNMTALAFLGGALIWIVVKILPDVHQKFVSQAESQAKAVIELQKIVSDTIKTMQAEFSLTLDKITARSHEDTKMITEAIEKMAQAVADLRTHCASVRGELEKKA